MITKRNLECIILLSIRARRSSRTSRGLVYSLRNFNASNVQNDCGRSLPGGIPGVDFFMCNCLCRPAAQLQGLSCGYAGHFPELLPDLPIFSSFEGFRQSVRLPYVYVDDLNMEFDGYMVEREVEQCQWHRTEYTETNEEGEKIKKYKYYTAWSSFPISSLGWDGLHNNFWDYSLSSGKTATSVFLGNYKIDADIMLNAKAKHTGNHSQTQA